jgi:putative membrane protein
MNGETQPHVNDLGRGPGDPPGDGSAPRRTWLAAERTYLAWVRTALGALGMAVAVGRLLPALAQVSHVTFGLLGAAYGVFGVLLLLLAAYRSRGIRAALAAQDPLPEHGWTLNVITGFGLVLAVLTIALIVVEI